MSTPFAGSDSKGVNSSSSEYIGTVAEGASADVTDNESVNLRVGLQYNKLLANAASGWSAISANLSDEATYFPFIGNNNVKATSSGSNVYTVIHDVGQSFAIDEENNLVFGFYITSAEYADIEFVNIKNYTSGDAENVEYNFTKEELVADCWNLLVCSFSNISTHDYSLGETLVKWYIEVNDGDGSSASPTFWVSGPVVAKNVSLEGFQPGTYTFNYTYLYDEEKQESLPFQFLDVGSGNVNKLNIVGNAVLLKFDSYISSHNSGGSAYAISKRITGSRIYYKLEENDNSK
jgi:hypothetical protein